MSLKIDWGDEEIPFDPNKVNEYNLSIGSNPYIASGVKESNQISNKAKVSILKTIQNIFSPKTRKGEVINKKNNTGKDNFFKRTYLPQGL